MRMVDLIEKKRDGGTLTPAEIRFIIQGYVEGQILDYQMSAWAMAVFFRGMETEEIAELTLAMAESGEQLDLSVLDGRFVDKHSTGGVGDKTTLLLSPMVAACGVPIAKMSGRGLGHTGGTIDKLSSIPGFKVELERDEFLQQVKDVGLAVIAQSGNIVPADKKLYALRDVTGTVPSIPLIASSVMSKKIAAGAQGIVLDVKYGSGAFMATLEDAQALAKTMVGIGKTLGRDTIAVLSAMEQPLGNAIGNAIEVIEVLEALQGKGPQDLVELCVELGALMLVAGRKVQNTQEGRKRVRETLENGQALAKFREFVRAQGGNLTNFEQKNFSLAPLRASYLAPISGYIQWIDARKIGHIAMVLGAGRVTKESKIDLGAGVYLYKKQGDWVEAGEPVLELYTSTEDKKAEGIALAQESVLVGPKKPENLPLIAEVIR
ncbi:pyrimidine-nucleoside phosphorylase [Desulfitobacterium metallireducens]|uniref:Pyrimidine-nucleoside phosphorylase n=1 Tax=Desulfitobacterium metallireducens DSM 15288 TaxID=871968 RepID=W0E904_9FIRM|nr:pyrimidine-nucleoside phosphorylase [Desulfitobacterium metallireducens]AHF07350.1 pyrimidine-nucleoside phosphorylase [Desulfitobacterium metallireducens DSM 15288]